MISVNSNCKPLLFIIRLVEKNSLVKKTQNSILINIALLFRSYILAGKFDICLAINYQKSI